MIQHKEHPSDPTAPRTDRIDLHRVPRMSVAAVRGDRIFFTENDGTRGQAMLYLDQRRGGPACPPGADTWVGPYNDRERRVLVDPNGLDAHGTTAITVFEPDDTGHGAGKPIEKQVDEQTDLYAFLFHYLTQASASGQTRR